MKYRRSVAAKVGIILLLGAILGLAAQDTAILPGQVGSLAAPVPWVRPDAATRARVSQAYGKLPLHFEANRGQADPRVKFLSHGSDYNLFLTPTEAVLSLHQGSKDVGDVLRMHLLGAHPAPQVKGLAPLPGKSHYFIGNDPGRWRTGIPHYAQVKYPGIYPGIDLVFYGNPRQLEYDFVVAPGADPKAIWLGFEGVDRLSLDEEGNLILQMAGGKLLQHAPVIYQEINGTRRAISGRYVLLALKSPDSGLETQKVGFEVAAYDPARPLVIDPMLEYSTYLGGNSADQGTEIDVDSSGNVCVTGWTSSANFPTAHPFQSAKGSGSDAFVAKLTPDGSTLVYSTYLGGGKDDQGTSIAVDSSGNAYVTGWTSSANFPTAHPFQPAFGGGDSDAFVVKLTSDGSIPVYSTYLGGRREDTSTDIAVDTSGNAYVTGETASRNFPTAHPFQPAFGGGDIDAFMVKLTPDGSALIYSTYLGGNSTDIGFGIAVDSSGNAYVTGGTQSRNFPRAHPFQPAFGGGGIGILNSDAFVTKFNPDGSALVYSTYLGGNSGDVGFGIAVDSSGNACVAGGTASRNFPTVRPFQSTYGGGFSDAFVTKFNPDGSALVYSTYLGGNNIDAGIGIAVDSSGNAYVAGATASPNFPTVRPFQSTYGGGNLNDAFMAKFNPDGSALVYSTYLGGSDNDASIGIAADSSGNAYVTGVTDSANFPTVNPFQPAFGGGKDSDAFIAKIVDVELVEPVLSITPSSLDFGHVNVGSSAEKTLTVRNMGGGTLAGSASTSAPYSVVSEGSYSLAAGQSQSVTVRFSPTADGTFQGDVTFTGGGGGGGGTVTVTGTGVTRVLVHDLAVTKITAPKMITLTAKKPARTVQVKVQIQNRSPHDEILQDMDMLGNAVSLTVESLGSCPPPVLHTGSPQRALPLTLKPKQTLAVVFDVTFDCANDRFKSTPASPGHEDYRYIAAVDHAAIDGEADSHPADDTCPRSVTPPFETDPYPDGKIKDRGCGGQKPDRTFGADILMDVVVK